MIRSLAASSPSPENEEPLLSSWRIKIRSTKIASFLLSWTLAQHFYGSRVEFRVANFRQHFDSTVAPISKVGPARSQSSSGPGAGRWRSEATIGSNRARARIERELSAARACRPAPLPLLLCRRPARLSRPPRGSLSHTRGCPTICATVHHSLTRFPAVTLATSFLIFLPPPPLHPTSFSAASGYSRRRLDAS